MDRNPVDYRTKYIKQRRAILDVRQSINYEGLLANAEPEEQERLRDAWALLVNAYDALRGEEYYTTEGHY